MQTCAICVLFLFGPQNPLELAEKLGQAMERWPNDLRLIDDNAKKSHNLEKAFEVVGVAFKSKLENIRTTEIVTTE